MSINPTDAFNTLRDFSFLRLFNMTLARMSPYRLDIG